MPERDYSHITISETDETELANMKLAYLTAARERDALEDKRDLLLTALKAGHVFFGQILDTGVEPEVFKIASEGYACTHEAGTAAGS